MELEFIKSHDWNTYLKSRGQRRDPCRTPPDNHYKKSKKQNLHLTLSYMDTISNDPMSYWEAQREKLAGICACEVKFQIQGGHAKGRVSHFWLKLSWNYGWVLLVIFYRTPILKGRTIRKVMVGVGNFRAAGIFFRFQIPWMIFFRPWHEYFLGLICVHEFIFI